MWSVHRLRAGLALAAIAVLPIVADAARADLDPSARPPAATVYQQTFGALCAADAIAAYDAARRAGRNALEAVPIGHDAGRACQRQLAAAAHAGLRRPPIAPVDPAVTVRPRLARDGG